MMCRIEIIWRNDTDKTHHQPGGYRTVSDWVTPKYLHQRLRVAVETACISLRCNPRDLTVRMIRIVTL